MLCSRQFLYSGEEICKKYIGSVFLNVQCVLDITFPICLGAEAVIYTYAYSGDEFCLEGFLAHDFHCTVSRFAQSVTHWSSHRFCGCSITYSCLLRRQGSSTATKNRYALERQLLSSYFFHFVVLLHRTFLYSFREWCVLSSIDYHSMNRIVCRIIVFIASSAHASR